MFIHISPNDIHIKQDTLNHIDASRCIIIYELMNIIQFIRHIIFKIQMHCILHILMHRYFLMYHFCMYKYQIDNTFTLESFGEKENQYLLIFHQK